MLAASYELEATDPDAGNLRLSRAPAHNSGPSVSRARGRRHSQVSTASTNKKARRLAALTLAALGHRLWRHRHQPLYALKEIFHGVMSRPPPTTSWVCCRWSSDHHDRHFGEVRAADPAAATTTAKAA